MTTAITLRRDHDERDLILVSLINFQYLKTIGHRQEAFVCVSLGPQYSVVCLQLKAENEEDPPPPITGDEVAVPHFNDLFPTRLYGEGAYPSCLSSVC